jgi:hypothetical protein
VAHAQHSTGAYLQPRVCFVPCVIFRYHAGYLLEVFLHCQERCAEVVQPAFHGWQRVVSCVLAKGKLDTALKPFQSQIIESIHGAVRGRCVRKQATTCSVKGLSSWYRFTGGDSH